MLDFIHELCQDVTGSHCSVPRWSEWSLVEPGQSSIGVDVADVATGGAAAVIPVNVKALGSYFTTGIVSDSGAKANLKGFGAGGALGAGWGIPFAGGKAVGKIPEGAVRTIAQKVGAAAQGKAVNMLLGATKLGVSGGTRLVYGPDAPPSGMNPMEFRGFATIVSLGANFVVNGVSGGLVMFSNNKPITDALDFIHATAIGLMGGAGIAASLEIEASGTVYEIRVD